MTTSLAPVPRRGICARCARPKAEHQGRDPRCAGYVSSVGKPPSIIPAGLVAIVDTREPDPERVDEPEHGGEQRRRNAADRMLGRARAPWIWNPETREQELVPRIRAKLPAGDYSAAGCVHRILIEYKTLGDLASTLFSDHPNAAGEELENYARFCESLALMASTAKRAVIVVPATPQQVKRKEYVCQAHPLSVLGRCNRIFLDFGIPTIWAGDEREAARQIGNLIKAAWEDEAAERKAKVTPCP